MVIVQWRELSGSIGVVTNTIDATCEPRPADDDYGQPVKMAQNTSQVHRVPSGRTV